MLVRDGKGRIAWYSLVHPLKFRHAGAEKVFWARRRYRSYPTVGAGSPNSSANMQSASSDVSRILLIRSNRRVMDTSDLFPHKSCMVMERFLTSDLILQLRLPALVLDFLHHLVLRSLSENLSQDFPTRALGDHIDQHNPTSEPLVHRHL